MLPATYIAHFLLDCTTIGIIRHHILKGKKGAQQCGVPQVDLQRTLVGNEFSATLSRQTLVKTTVSLVYTYFVATNYSNGVGSQVLATLVTTFPHTYTDQSKHVNMATKHIFNYTKS